MSGSSDDQQQRPQPQLPGGGLLMGRPFGIPIYVSPTWLLIAGFITIVFAPGHNGNAPIEGLSSAGSYAVSFTFAVLLYLSVLVHELAHSVVAKRIGLPVRRITIYFLGGVSEIEREPETPKREFAVAFAGPLLSLVLAGVGYLAWNVIPDGSGTGTQILVHLVGSLWAANLLVAIFNLLPGLPLDGGRLLRAVVWGVSKRSQTGTLVAAWTGRGLAVLIMIGVLWRASYNGSTDFYTVIWGAFISSFIWMGASQSLAVGRMRERLPGLQVRGLTRRALPVDAALPLAEALRRAHEAGARALVTVASDGKPVGLVNEAAVIATPEQRRPWVDVSTVTKTLQPEMVISVDLGGEALLGAMRAFPATEYLVVETGGEIFGVLAAADVEAAFLGR